MTVPARALRGWLPVAVVRRSSSTRLTKAWALEALDDRNIDRVLDACGSTCRSTPVWRSAPVPELGSGHRRGRARRDRRPAAQPANANRERLSDVSVGLIVGGAIGNLIDRASSAIRRGCAVRSIDFIDFQWFPIFNVADMGVTMGAALLVLSSWLLSRDGEDDAERDDARR